MYRIPIKILARWKSSQNTVWLTACGSSLDLAVAVFPPVRRRSLPMLALRSMRGGTLAAQCANGPRKAWSTFSRKRRELLSIHTFSSNYFITLQVNMTTDYRTIQTSTVRWKGNKNYSFIVISALLRKKSWGFSGPWHLSPLLFFLLRLRHD